MRFISISWTRGLTVVAGGMALALSFSSNAFTQPPKAPASPAPAGGCPPINAIGSRVIKPDLSVHFSSVTNQDLSTTITYNVTTPNEIANPGDTVPGLISYCVYPSQQPGNPDGSPTQALYPNWRLATKLAKDDFAFTRDHGNPDNIPFDGTNRIVGEAKWTAAAGATTAPTILLHINDPAACSALYPDQAPLQTCFVFPGEAETRPGGEDTPPGGEDTPPGGEDTPPCPA